MKHLCLTIGLLTILSAANASEAILFPQKFNFPKTEVFYKHTGPLDHINGIDENRKYSDLDGDGLYDLVDPDIDGDGVTNYLDISPLDDKVMGEDKDSDGIPDFVDFKIDNKLQENMNHESARLQELVFQQKGIIIFNGDKSFSNKEFQQLANLFITGELKNLPRLNTLKVIFKQPEHAMGHRGKYRHSHFALTLFNHIDFRKRPEHQELTTVHEVFHALSYQEEDFWNNFLDISGWQETEDHYIYLGKSFSKSTFRTNAALIAKQIQDPSFPNDYSKMGPEEMFAECATASLLANRGHSIKFKYPKLESYLSSDMHRFFLKSLQNILK